MKLDHLLRFSLRTTISWPVSHLLAWQGVTSCNIFIEAILFRMSPLIIKPSAQEMSVLTKVAKHVHTHAMRY